MLEKVVVDFLYDLGNSMLKEIEKQPLEEQFIALKTSMFVGKDGHGEDKKAYALGLVLVSHDKKMVEGWAKAINDLQEDWQTYDISIGGKDVSKKDT